MRLQRPALTESSLPAPPESGKGEGAACAPHFTSGGAQVLGLIIKDLPTDSADEATFETVPEALIIKAGLLAAAELFNEPLKMAV